MSEPFHSRIPTLPDEALREYARNPLDYKAEAVELALAELTRRGVPLPAEELRHLKAALSQRDAPLNEGWGDRLLGAAPEPRRTRVRFITSAILVAGLGSAAAIYLTAPPKAPNPLGYDPLDTKKYRRDLELYGGQVNVLSAELMRWWEGLWQGRQLAGTVAWLTVCGTTLFWFVASRPPTRRGDGKPLE